MIILARCFVLLQILDESDKKLAIREVKLHNFSDTIKNGQNTNFEYLRRLMQNLTLNKWANLNKTLHKHHTYSHY